MKEQIRRVLDMAARGRLGPEDAGALLAALSPRLNFTAGRWEQLFALLGEDAFSAEELATLLEVRAGVRRPDFDFGLEDVPRAVRDAVSAVNGAFGRERAAHFWGPEAPPRPPRPGSLLRVEVQEADGSELRANLPLSLAEHAAKLLPPRVLAALERGGVSPEALTMLLAAHPPMGELLAMEGADGSEISLRVE